MTLTFTLEVEILYFLIKTHFAIRQIRYNVTGGSRLGHQQLPVAHVIPGQTKAEI